MIATEDGGYESASDYDEETLALITTLVQRAPKQTVFNPFPRWHLEPSPSECGR